MVRDEIVRVRRLLTLMLVLLAFLTATLVALGSKSVFLPLLVLVIGASSLLFVDWLEWFSLHHVLAYFGMILGTIVALVDYFRSAGADTSQQLCAIASLLIYPELVIMLQRKNLRLFEQLAIFLLLEIIVAALVNDDVLFGILLAPIVLLWVASLLLFTRYAALIQLAPDLDKPTPRAIELIMEAWTRARARHQPTPSKMLDVVQPANARTQSASLFMLIGQAGPIGIVSLVFAGLYFYLLPRAAGDMESLALAPRTGLSDTMVLGSMGQLLQDKEVAMRLSLRDAKTGEPYRLESPPYIRGTVVSRYFRDHNSRTTSFQGTDAHQAGELLEPLAALHYPEDAIAGDKVIANFEIVSGDGSLLPCIAPMINSDRDQQFMMIIPFEWRLFDKRSDHFPHRSKLSYELMTTAFRQGQEWPVLPESRRLINRPNRNTQAFLLSQLSKARQERQSYATGWIDKFIDKVKQRSPDSTSRINLARAIENHLALSGEFTYSLAPNISKSTDIDPIEDFVVNQKRGHCQYYAAALTMALRHIGIPTRIVVGYHPLEYNEIGEYFTIRKSDAHAWVEAYFTADELREIGLYTPELGDYGGWLRLDPTPAGPGSNAGNDLRAQSDQGVDYVNRVWSEYVLNGRQRAEENSLYAPLQESTVETYKKMLEVAKELIKRARESQFVGGAINREQWLSWPVAVLIMLASAALVVLFRSARWLPRLAPQLARKLGLRQSAEDIQQQFFKKCMRMLRRAGFVRSTSETVQEYTSTAADSLQRSQQWRNAPRQLSLLTDAYYQVRFGGNKVLEPETLERVSQALGEMEESVAKTKK